MKLERIHLRRFRTHANTELTFPDEGIVGLIGQNESGKSTLATEALGWALFGSRAIRKTMDSIRWKGAPARKIAEVTLDFEVGGTPYRIERSENDATLRERGGRILAESISGVDATVPRVLGMDLDEFESSYMAVQGDLDRLNTMGGVAKRRFVLGLMGMGRIDEAIEACRERKNELKNEAQGLREGLGEREPLEAELTEAEDEVATVGAKIEDELRPRSVETGEALSEIGEQVEEGRQEKEKHEALTRQETEARSQAKQAGEELERAEAKLSEARGAAEELERRRPEIEPMADLYEERQTLQEARARAKERRTLEEMVAEATEKVQSTYERVEELEIEVEKLKAEKPRKVLLEARERVEETRARRDELSDHDKVAAIRTHLERGEPCPVCQQTVGEVPEASEAERRMQEAKDDHREALDAEMAAEGQVKKLDRLEEKLEDAREAHVEADKKRDRVAEKLEAADVPAFNATRLAQVEGEIERLEAVEKELRQLKARADRVEELEAEARRWKEKREAARSRAGAASEGLERLDFDPETHAALENTLTERREAAQAASEALSRATTRLEAAKERVSRAREQLEAYDERAEHVREVEEAHRVHVQADERLNAFRSAEASSIRPELEELVSGFLAVLTDGRHEAATLTEDFDLQVFEAGDHQEVISGGAEDVAAIALRLAISQLVSERAGHPLSLLVLDEPFGSLDAARRGNVVRLIRELRGVFAQILLISHIEEVQDAVDVAHRCEFREEETRSVLIQESANPEIQEVA